MCHVLDHMLWGMSVGVLGRYALSSAVAEFQIDQVAGDGLVQSVTGFTLIRVNLLLIKNRDKHLTFTFPTPVS